MTIREHTDSGTDKPPLPTAAKRSKGDGCEQIRKEVTSMTKKQLQQCLINQRIWEEEQKRNRW